MILNLSSSLKTAQKISEAEWYKRQNLDLHSIRVRNFPMPADFQTAVDRGLHLDQSVVRIFLILLLTERRVDAVQQKLQYQSTTSLNNATGGELPACVALLTLVSDLVMIKLADELVLFRLYVHKSLCSPSDPAHISTDALCNVLTKETSSSANAERPHCKVG